MMAGSFTAQVDKWVSETKERMLAVTQESSQRVVDEILMPRAKGGNLRVDTGFMRSSFRMSRNAPVLGLRSNPNPDATKNSFPDPSGDIAMTIAGMDLGDDLYGTFGANYAIYREYGANGQAGDGMVRLAAQKWPQIVNQVAAEARSRSGQ